MLAQSVIIAEYLDVTIGQRLIGGFEQSGVIPLPIFGN
jgi:hypothetical protein